MTEKNQRGQECRIASGRHSGLRSWAHTFLVLTVLVPAFSMETTTPVFYSDKRSIGTKGDYRTTKESAARTIAAQAGKGPAKRPEGPLP